MSVKPVCAALGEDIENRFIYADYSKKISMDFKDASLIDVLKIFSKQSGMNFISSGAVANKKITLFLDNIPIEEALDKILDANDLTYEMAANSDVFVVKPKAAPSMVTRVFPLKYATVPSASINSAAKTPKAGIADAIKAVMSKNGKLLEDSRTNSFIVTDDPNQFVLIEDTIAKLDVPVLQILIQVEMLDVSKSASDQMGIKFGQTPVTFTGKTTDTPFDSWQAMWEEGNLNSSGMTAALEFLKSQTDTRSLARPRILTLNNQTASIEISTNEAIGSSQSQTSVGSSGSISSAGAERAKTGVSLEVTPQANVATGEIILAVKPKVSEAKQGGTFEGKAFKDPEERTSQSILKVNSGETVIIGGLLRVEGQDVLTKLPFLGDVPVAGAAFRHTNKTSKDRELIIFITPYILDDKIKQKMEQAKAVRLDREVGSNMASSSVDVVSQQLDSAEMAN